MGFQPGGRRGRWPRCRLVGIHPRSLSAHPRFVNFKEHYHAQKIYEYRHESHVFHFCPVCLDGTPDRTVCEPGCGVTTFIKKVLSLWTGDVDVFDEGNSDAVNIPAALKAVSIKRKAIVSMNARNIAEVEATLTRHIAPLN